MRGTSPKRLLVIVTVTFVVLALVWWGFLRTAFMAFGDTFEGFDIVEAINEQ